MRTAPSLIWNPKTQTCVWLIYKRLNWYYKIKKLTIIFIVIICNYDLNDYTIGTTIMNTPALVIPRSYNQFSLFNIIVFTLIISEIEIFQKDFLKILQPKNSIRKIYSWSRERHEVEV